MSQLDREGTFRAQVVDAEIVPSDSGAVMANFKFMVLQQFDKASKTMGEMWPAEWEFRGNLCLVKRDGEVMKDNVQRITRSLGWNGDTKAIGETIGRICRCDVKADTYNGKTSYKADKINLDTDGPDLTDIDDKFGGMFKAFAAEVGPITPASAPVPVTAPAPAGNTAPAEPVNLDVPAGDTVNF